MADNEELRVSMLAEIEALKAAQPALAAKQAALAAEVEEALDAVERFENGTVASYLGAPEASGLGLLVDQRIELTSNRFDTTVDLIELTSNRFDTTVEEVDARLSSLSQFGDTVREAMATAEQRRVAAQRALETIADEQRRTSDEMKITLNAAMQAMEAMQGQWDEAVAANTVELRELRVDASAADTKQTEQLAGVEQMRADVAARAEALAELREERRSLAAEEAALRRRFAQLSQRRKAKSGGGGNRFPDIELPDIDLEAASASLEAAGATAEKAAGALFQLFGQQKEKPKLKPADDTEGDDAAWTPSGTLPMAGRLGGNNWSSQIYVAAYRPSSRVL
eukprot:CAMPEP_0115890786 /NCGR_PEP_ID=MMETSP0287-20121206/33529_1 /TAXON_ID=412157 /ORGANISM="Chrysochromulina rotalis, Strain UIO044" /LENGTH=338 /DNA_ID=CAMNT_0003347565 /DNA_START=3 /DNA_END=1020 /DNA_ORIENTATION=-